MPLLPYYEQHDLVVMIDGMAPIEEVSAQIDQVMKRIA
jgi:adenylate kinase family enzyme